MTARPERNPRSGRAAARRRLPWLSCLTLPALLFSLPSQGQESTPELKPQQSLRAEIGGRSDRFRIQAGADHLLEISLEQHGIDVELELHSPSGELVAKMDSPNGPWGLEPLWALTPEDGAYQLTVRPQSSVSSGAYSLEFTDLRPATERDRLLAAAAADYAAGLRSGWGLTSSEYQKVVAHHTRSLAAFRDLGVRPGIVRSLYRLGEVYLGTHEVWRVPELWEEARLLWAELGDDTGEAITLSSLGFFYQSIGEAETALARYEDSLAIWQARGSERGQARVLEDIGAIFERWGDDAGAIGHLEQAAELWRRQPYPVVEPRRLFVEARAARLAGDGRKALDLYDRSIQGFRDIDLLTGPLVWALQESAQLAQQFGRGEVAEQRLLEAIEHWRGGANLLEEAQAHVDLGILYATQGRGKKAEASLRAALDLADLVEDRRAQTRALAELAILARDRGELAEAEALIERALNLSESLRTEVARHGLRASYLARQRSSYELYIDLLMERERTRPGQGYAAQAFEVSERARARNLLDTLHEARAEPWLEGGTELVALERQLRRKLNSLEFLRLQILGREHSETEAQEIESRLEAALREYKSVQGRLRSESPRLAALTQPETLSAETVQSQVLDDHTLLLEFALGDERSWAWAVTPSELTAIELPPRSQIEAAARETYSLMTARNADVGAETPEVRRSRLAAARSELAASSQRLSAMILAPAAELLADRRLVVVPDGALQYLPFAALPHPVSGEPLIVEREVVSIPSASIMAVQRRHLAGRAPAPSLVAVVADPVFDPADRRVARLGDALPQPGADQSGPALLRAQRSLGLNRFSRLRFSRLEAANILDMAPRDTSLSAIDFLASKDAVTAGSLSDYRLVHFATHGILDSKNPELSGLVLSLVDRAGGIRDGFLRLHDVYNLDLNAELVTLSACQTALGKEIRGEGLVGLTRGFLFAGAERVVASLWGVQDRSTAELMKRFYRGILEERMEPAQALRRAQVSMLREARWEEPYHWAAFVLQGEWR